MKKLYPSIFLAAIVISAIAATVKISDLPISTSPSTNTFIEIADMDAVTKSSKYLLTNLVTQSAFTAATNSITTSAANWTADGTTNSTLTGNARANAVVATNGITAGVVAATKAFQSYQGSLTHAGTVTLDFDATTTVNRMALTGNVTLATSNLATNRTYRLLIVGASTNATYTFPAWNFVGYKPTSIAANKWGMLSLEAWGANDTNVVASYAEQP